MTTNETKDDRIKRVGKDWCWADMGAELAVADPEKAGVPALIWKMSVEDRRAALNEWLSRTCPAYTDLETEDRMAALWWVEGGYLGRWHSDHPLNLTGSEPCPAGVFSLWHGPHKHLHDGAECRVGIAPDFRLPGDSKRHLLNGDFCPREGLRAAGDTALHHIEGRTVLAFWFGEKDNDLDRHYTFVLPGTLNFESALAAARAACPRHWERCEHFELRLVEALDSNGNTHAAVDGQ